MADWSGFRTRPRCVLLASGECAGAMGEPVDLPQRGRIVLSRALCQFEAFAARPGLAGAGLIAAARLHADAHGPFPETDYVLYRQGNGVAIWYWDRATVSGLLGGRPYLAEDFVPEGAGERFSAGFRLITAAEGEEAQFWRSGTLAASLWRRRPFTDEQWSAFVDASEGGGEAGRRPQPVARDVLAGDGAGRIRRPLSWRDLEKVSLAVALGAFVVAAFLAGQAARIQGAVEPPEVSADDSAAAQGNRAVLKAYAAAAADPGFLTVASDVLDIAKELGAEPARWSSSPGAIELEFVDIDAETLASMTARLESVPRVIRVLPDRNSRSGRTTVALTLRTGGPVR